MPQLHRDAYSMLQRVIEWSHPITVLDVGAHVGDVSRRIASQFPHATIHAFEPTPASFAGLVGAARQCPAIQPVRMAAGNANGTARFRVTGDARFSSVLPPSERGLAYHGGAIETVEEIEAPVRRLDDWAVDAGVPRADLIKIDVQGLELDVLRGAERLVGTALAVNSEAQMVPEYAGAATFSEIDLHLRSRGFLLHQLHEVWVQGAEYQTICVDGLWLRSEALEWLREDPERAYEAGYRARVARAICECVQRGRARVALYGAGRHTRAALAPGRVMPPRPVAILDDDPSLEGTRLQGVPIISADRAGSLGVDAVVLSSHFHEAQLWEASLPLRERGIEVVRLYGAAA